MKRLLTRRTRKQASMEQNDVCCMTTNWEYFIYCPTTLILGAAVFHRSKKRVVSKMSRNHDYQMLFNFKSRQYFKVTALWELRWSELSLFSYSQSTCLTYTSLRHVKKSWLMNWIYMCGLFGEIILYSDNEGNIVLWNCTRVGHIFKLRIWSIHSFIGCPIQLLRTSRPVQYNMFTSSHWFSRTDHPFLVQ